MLPRLKVPTERELDVSDVTTGSTHDDPSRLVCPCFHRVLILSLGVNAQSDWTFCANEGGLCAFTGTKEVQYGANGSYSYKTLTGGTACTNAVFGDPLPGK